MKQKHPMSNTLFGAAAAVAVMGIATTIATATEPCGDLGECKALIEINTTDGDIGFHFLMDGDDLVKGEVRNPDGKKIFKVDAKRELREQFFTELFVESAEPLCFDPTNDDDVENDDEDFVTLEEFLERWAAGTYVFKGKGDEGEKSEGESELTYELPAAPKDLMFDDVSGVISWAAGDDLGECATNKELDDLVEEEVLPVHPEDVVVAAWEVVFEPDVDDGDPLGKLKFTIRVSGNLADFAPLTVTVPAEYLASLPDDTLVKIEVGAIGETDNATFTEVGDICVHGNEGCGDEEE
ncbi:MAG: hypothetical protein IH907_02100 [Proteobacteria bacterium]|nr:hypothetical protein [Pseudomonadota bacterium]